MLSASLNKTSLYLPFDQATIRRAAMVTKTMDQNRDTEEKQQDRLRDVARARMIQSNLERENRVTDKRILRRQMVENKEREMEEAILRVSTAAFRSFVRDEKN